MRVSESGKNLKCPLRCASKQELSQLAQADQFRGWVGLSTEAVMT